MDYLILMDIGSQLRQLSQEGGGSSISFPGWLIPVGFFVIIGILFLYYSLKKEDE